MATTLHGALAAAIAFLAIACGGDDPAPIAVVVAAAPTEIVVGDDALDDVTVTVEYRDDDGDLGGGVALVVDCRAIDLEVALPLPAIASDEAVAAGVPIEGALDLVVADVGYVEIAPEAPEACTDLGVGPLTTGSVVFCVFLTDSGGHTGPGDCTGPISVVSN